MTFSMIPALVAAALGLARPPPATAPDGLCVEYFAIGSNMASRVFEGRRGIKPSAKRPAVALDHALTFDVPGAGFAEPAFAAISSRTGSECHGVLYTISPLDWLRLCASEAVPVAYVPAFLTVECYDGRRVEAVSLQAAPGLPRRRGGTDEPRPSARYLSLLRDGAAEAGLAPVWLEYLDRLEPAVGSTPAPLPAPPPRRNYEERYGATFV